MPNRVRLVSVWALGAVISAAVSTVHRLLRRGPGASPQPLAVGAHAGVSVSATPVTRDQTAPAEVMGGEQGVPWDLLPLLWLLPILAAGGALLTRWRQRRTEQTPAPPPRADDMDWLAQDPGGDDRA